MWSVATWSGWVVVVLFASAATIPLSHRLFAGRRAAPQSRAIQVHVIMGIGTTAAALFHSLGVLPSLGSPAAISGGMTALAPGALAFFLLFAHVGVGLQLRAPKLKDRVQKRRQHLMFAIGIAVAIAAHVIALR